MGLLLPQQQQEWGKKDGLGYFEVTTIPGHREDPCRVISDNGEDENTPPQEREDSVCVIGEHGDKFLSEVDGMGLMENINGGFKGDAICREK